MLYLLVNGFEEGGPSDNENSVNISRFHELPQENEVLFFVYEVGVHVAELFFADVHEGNGEVGVAVVDELLEVEFRFFVEVDLIAGEFEEEIDVLIWVETA